LLTDVAECGTATVPLGYGVLVDPYPDQSPCVVTVDVARGEKRKRERERERNREREKERERKRKRKLPCCCMFACVREKRQTNHLHAVV
jgi:tmRNA-binding protein